MQAALQGNEQRWTYVTSTCRLILSEPGVMFNSETFIFPKEGSYNKTRPVKVSRETNTGWRPDATEILITVACTLGLGKVQSRIGTVPKVGVVHLLRVRQADIAHPSVIYYPRPLLCHQV